MDINRKYIIIFGTLILLLVFITGAITYYKEKAEQAQIPDVEQSVLSSSQYNPAGPEELLYFISYCKNVGLFLDLEEVKNKEIKEIVCTIGQERKKMVLNEKTRLVGAYIPSILPLDSITSFKLDRYIGISVDLKDVLRKYDPSLLEEEKLYFCSISEPSWADPFYLQIVPKQDLIFDGGDISCADIKMDGIKMGKTPFITFSGFVPQAEALNIRYYLVDEQTVSEVMSKQSFSEIKEILSNYSIIWQMEKPIIP